MKTRNSHVCIDLKKYSPSIRSIFHYLQEGKIPEELLDTKYFPIPLTSAVVWHVSLKTHSTHIHCAYSTLPFQCALSQTAIWFTSINKPVLAENTFFEG